MQEAKYQEGRPVLELDSFLLLFPHSNLSNQDFLSLTNGVIHPIHKGNTKGKQRVTTAPAPPRFLNRREGYQNFLTYLF